MEPTAPSGDVLALLPLPDIERLTERQRRGLECAWDGVTLAPQTAVNLGEQGVPAPDGSGLVYLRGCRYCVAERAHHALFDHCSTCADCAKAGQCAIGRGVYRLVREYRR